MKAVRWALVILLGVTALIQLGEGVASIVDPAALMNGLNLSMAPGVEVPVTFLGVAMIVRAAVTVVALVWVLRNKSEGLFLARFTALTILLSAPVMYFRLRRPEFAFGDLVQGLLLLVPALALKGPGRG
jgi:hypothetical protein